MPRAIPLAVLLPFVACPFLVQPGRAAETCADGATVMTHRIATLASVPTGTTRPAVTLAELQPAGKRAVTIVVDGVIIPAKGGEAARAGLASVVASLKDAPVALVASAGGPDRYGRPHGILRLEQGGSVGERLLTAGAGLADVAFAPCANHFLAAEADARAENRGIWRQSRIWTDLNTAAGGLPDFVLGRGRVASVGRSGRTTYINFGSDFRADATVRLRESMTSALVAAGRPPDSLSGRVVEVRGWASQRNGLDMELDSPLALQVPSGASDTGTD